MKNKIWDDETEEETRLNIKINLCGQKRKWKNGRRLSAGYEIQYPSMTDSRVFICYHFDMPEEPFSRTTGPTWSVIAVHRRQQQTATDNTADISHESLTVSRTRRIYMTDRETHTADPHTWYTMVLKFRDKILNDTRTFRSRAQNP